MTARLIGVLSLGVLLAFSAAACDSGKPGDGEAAKSPSTTTPSAPCERACLEDFVNGLIDAMIAHDPSRARLAEAVRYTENGQEIAIGDALWQTASGRESFAIYAADSTTGQAAYSGVIKESDRPALMSLRIKVENERISEIEAIVARSDMGFFNVEGLIEAEPIYAETLAPESRSSRDDMVKIADSYFAALERMDGTRPVPFDESCNRIENGVQTTNNPKFPSQNGFSIAALPCVEQFKTGYFKFVTEIRRAFTVIDEERGLAFGFALLDHAGDIKEVTLTDGRTLPTNTLAPFSWLGGGLFKIKDGKIHRIHTVLIRAPYKMKRGWEIS